MGLAEIQRDFRDCLEHDDAAAAGRLGLAGSAGLAVHLNNYRAQLTGCLEESYPQTLAWIGIERFEAMAVRHIARVSPNSWTLDDYATDFPETLEEELPYDPEVAELARLELALARAFVAEDAEVLGIADLAALDWDRVDLRRVPSAEILGMRSNAPEIWSALAEGAQSASATLHADWRPFVVWRRDFVCCFRELDVSEHELLELLGIADTPFDTICARLVERLGQSDGIALAGSLLAQWAQDGLLIRPEENTP